MTGVKGFVTGKIVKTAEEVNAEFIKKGWKPPYSANSSVAEFTNTQNQKFVKLYRINNSS